MKSARFMCSIAIAGILFLCGYSAKADTLAEVTTLTVPNAAAFFGQSFATPSGGPWSQITFNFYSDVPATTPSAVGTGFILSLEYLGTPADLSSSAAGFMAESTGISGGRFVFDPLLVLQPDTRYYFYGNAEFAAGTVTGGWDGFTETQTWVSWSYLSTENFESGFEVASANFNVSGTPIPETSTIALLGIGLIGLISYGWRRRK